MSLLKRIYFNFFVLVYMLYALFNKGVAYTYLSEFTIVLGLLLILRNIRAYEIVWDRRMAILTIFMLVAELYICRGILGGYAIADVIRDSVIFNYIVFAFIVYFFKEELPYLKKKLFVVYKWYPLIMCCVFFLSSYIPFFHDLRLFGNQPLFVNKFADLGIHLFIASVLLLNGDIVLSKRFFIIQWVLIIYLFLIVSSYTRAGMISYVIPMVVFFIYTKNNQLRKQMLKWLRYVPLLIVLALPLFLSTNLGENFQGRTVSIEQLKKNAISIFSSDDDGSTLSGNKVWRLLWWGKIIDYTFLGEYFVWGKGLGMSLADSDGIPYDPEEGNLRSPHNFHLTVLARFGVPMFFLWMYWMYLHLREIKKRDLKPSILVLLVITLSFLINASFDVFLEGPMGAMPFWIFVGLIYSEEAFNLVPRFKPLQHTSILGKDKIT